MHSSWNSLRNHRHQNKLQRKILSWPFRGTAVDKHCRMGSAHFQMKKAWMRAESGPSSSMTAKQTKLTDIRDDVSLPGVRTQLRYMQIRNICSICDPAADISQLQAAEERRMSSTKRTLERIQALTLGTLQHHKALHGCKEAKRSCAPVLERSNEREWQKQETEVNGTQKDYPWGTTSKHRFSCQQVDALDARDNCFPSIVLK